MRLLAALLAGVLAASLVFARGGGGCLAEGTPIATPDGTRAIESLRPGDAVLAWQGGGVVTDRVADVYAVDPAEYVEIASAGRVLRLTPEHPVAVGVGVFRAAGTLQAGDALQLPDGARSEPIQHVARVAASSRAFNLLVERTGVFVANGALVHNKGCFLPDTPILRADGSVVPIAAVRNGEHLLAFDEGGNLATATVQQVITHDVEEIVELTAGGRLVRVTPEHPFRVGAGEFRTVAALHPGDTIFLCDGTGLHPAAITCIERIRQAARVYNLRTDQPHTFFANAFAVHNKGGGCFPAGTRVATPDGAAAIETLPPGAAVVGVAADGRRETVRVVRTIRLLGAPREVRTSAGVLCATDGHPVRLADGSFRPLGELAAGMRVCVARGEGLVAAEVLAAGAAQAPQEVFNLEVESPHTFIADGFVVHNKGGGGSHSSGGHHSGSGGGGSGDPTVAFLIIGVIFVVVIVSKVRESRQHENQDLDYCYSASAVAGKAGKTEKLLQFLARQDASMQPSALHDLARQTFITLQQCWQAREYAPMEPLMMTDLYRQHCAQIAGMKRNHEINVIANLQVVRIDLVHVRYMHRPEQNEFTALITARARDYYTDDRTGRFLRGDGANATFQEFWTFQRQGNGWKLREIEQTRESDVLKDENFVEMFTDQQVRQVYAETAAAAAGPAGPWVGGRLETKATRTERLLNFLSQIDSHWQRDAMRERARQVFTAVKMSEEGGETAPVAADLFPEALAQLDGHLLARQAQGIRMEYRNFCIRKVEIVLVRNFNDNTRDEYTTRISWHAQVIVTRADGTETRHDEDVTPYVEFWTFGRRDNAWKLKEVLPAAAGEQAQQQENMDEGASAQMLQWYYTKNRAN
jgi:predicted lipid-binding transport protein (Tim44 family)